MHRGENRLARRQVPAYVAMQSPSDHLSQGLAQHRDPLGHRRAAYVLKRTHPTAIETEAVSGGVTKLRLGRDAVESHGECLGRPTPSRIAFDGGCGTELGDGPQDLIHLTSHRQHGVHASAETQSRPVAGRPVNESSDDWVACAASTGSSCTGTCPSPVARRLPHHALRSRGKGIRGIPFPLDRAWGCRLPAGRPVNEISDDWVACAASTGSSCTGTCPSPVARPSPRPPRLGYRHAAAGIGWTDREHGSGVAVVVSWRAQRASHPPMVTTSSIDERGARRPSRITRPVPVAMRSPVKRRRPGRPGAREEQPAPVIAHETGAGGLWAGGCCVSRPARRPARR